MPVKVNINNLDGSAQSYEIGTGGTITDLSNPTTGQDSLTQLADSVGLVDAMQTQNSQSYEEDQNLRTQFQSDGTPLTDQDHYQQESFSENEENPQESLEETQEESLESHSKPHRKKRKTKDNYNERFGELTSKLYYERDKALEAQKELQKKKEELELEKKEKEELRKILLSSQGKSIDKDLGTLSEIMAKAQSEGDTETFIKANDFRTNLILEKKKTEEAYQQISRQEQESKVEIDPEVLDMFDKKELNSEMLEWWLEANPYYDPRSEDFDADLAQDVKTIKKQLNKFLKFEGQSHMIGTEEYYHNLNEIIQERIYGPVSPSYYSQQKPQQKSQSLPYQTEGYQQRASSQNYQKDGTNMRISISTPEKTAARFNNPQSYHGSVNRGYTNTNQGNNKPLTAEQKYILEKVYSKTPMFDQNGRELTWAERVQSYKNNI